MTRPPEDDENTWRLVIAGFQRTPVPVQFDLAQLPFGTKLEILKESPEGNEWVKLLPPGNVPQGAYIRKRLDPDAKNRKARRTARQERKAAGIARKAIRKAQEIPIDPVDMEVRPRQVVTPKKRPGIVISVMGRRVMDLQEAGWSLTQIAQHCGVDKNAMIRLLKDPNGDLRYVTGLLLVRLHEAEMAGENEWTRIIRDLVVKHGMTFEEISTACRVSTQYLRYGFRKDKMMPRYRLGQALIRLHRKRSQAVGPWTNRIEAVLWIAAALLAGYLLGCAVMVAEIRASTPAAAVEVTPAAAVEVQTGEVVEPEEEETEWEPEPAKPGCPPKMTALGLCGKVKW